MKEIILDGKEFIDIQTTHQILKKVFEFPDYYGGNLDALWDCITDYFIGEKGIITWRDFVISQKYLGKEADKILEVFQEAAMKYGDFTIEVIP